MQEYIKGYENTSEKLKPEPGFVLHYGEFSQADYSSGDGVEYYNKYYPPTIDGLKDALKKAPEVDFSGYAYVEVSLSISGQNYLPGEGKYIRSLYDNYEWLSTE